MRLHNLFDLTSLPKAWVYLQAVINGNIDMENMRWRLTEYTTNGTPNTEDVVPHSLGRTPSGFLVLSIDKPGIVYQSAASTNAFLKLKCNVADANVRLVVL